MEINCVFKPCEDCETRSHCYKYWKSKALGIAGDYQYALGHIQDLQKEIKELKEDNKNVVSILREISIKFPVEVNYGIQGN